MDFFVGCWCFENVSLSGVIAITAIVGVAGLLQAAAGPVAIVDRDSCAFSSGGSEICVDSADEPGLEQMTRDISALEEYLPDGVRPRKLASISAYRIKSGDHGYQQFTTAGEDRRLDISGLLLDELGIGSCTDPTSEGAFVIDRIGVYITKRTGVYSKSVEKMVLSTKVFPRAVRRIQHRRTFCLPLNTVRSTKI